ncbi:zip-9 [Pristionchus pacificus]|uniref:Zip-9 n=1 Tax=Pristionchus pacificus TaxID=54126 RepID=A0A2A6CAK4_PRIPA|nr:zip-9 [Pristionchus pacificus]|eukprot:PDM75136.1 zip-9 [Pristionchus pacificus]
MSFNRPSFQLVLNFTPVRSLQLSTIKKRNKKMSSSHDLGYFLCEEVSPLMATLPAESEWSVWQNESCTLASRSVDECACSQGEDGDDGASEGWRWRWCAVQMPDCAAVMVEMTHCKRDECAAADGEWCCWEGGVDDESVNYRLSLKASPSFDRGSSDCRAPRGNSQSCTNLINDKKRVKRAQSPKCGSMRASSPNSQCSSSCVCAEIDGSLGCGFGGANCQSTVQQVQQCSFVGGLLDSQYCLLHSGIGSCSIHPHPCSSPCGHASAQSSFACDYGCSSYTTEEHVTANVFAEVYPSPLHPVSSSSSPIHDSSSPLSYHSFNIPLSDSPDSNADYNQHYSPYDKVSYEKDFSDLDLDQEIIDEFLIPDRQELYQLDYSDIQFDSIPSSPSFYSFIDDIIGEVREEIHIEKSSPSSPSDTLAESISLIAHSDIDAKLKIVTSSGCSDKAYKVTIEPVKKSRKRLAAPPPPNGAKKERIDISKLSREEAAERKRYQNRVAAQRYRAKIREERDSEFNECAFLEKRNEFLREQEEILSSEIAKYKALLLDRAATQ